MLSVIKRSNLWLSISAVLVVLSLVFVGIFGLNLGIDFTGGSLLEANIGESFSVEDVRGLLDEKGYDAVVQSGEDNLLIVRTRTLSPEEHTDVVNALTERYSGVEEQRFESIGPVVGKELQRKSAAAVVILSVLIVLYVAWAFRKVSEPVASWKYGLLTIIAALHDIIIPLGAFAILGKFAGYQLDTAVIAALLTILGYSINDTIVVFDRTRENLTEGRHSDEVFADTVDKSVRQSFARSINTSITTLLVLLAIFFFGGDTTKPFILALIIGIASGAYSSIFIASPLLVKWRGSKEN